MELNIKSLQIGCTKINKNFSARAILKESIQDKFTQRFACCFLLFTDKIPNISNYYVRDYEIPFKIKVD